MIIGQRIEYFMIECDCGSEGSTTDYSEQSNKNYYDNTYCDKCNKKIMSLNQATGKTTIHKKNFKKTRVLNVDDTKVYYKLKSL